MSTVVLSPSGGASASVSSWPERVFGEGPEIHGWVNLSDNGDLMEKFLALPFPRMYGEQNRSLTYLPHLAANGIQLAEITRSGHFPMYSNAPEMWDRIAAFQRQAAAARH